MSPVPIEIVVNGEPRRCPAGSTVASLLAELGRDPRTVAVELNGEIARRARFAELALGPGDAVEVVHFVQGGAS